MWNDTMMRYKPEIVCTWQICCDCQHCRETWTKQLWPNDIDLTKKRLEKPRGEFFFRTQRIANRLHHSIDFGYTRIHILFCIYIKDLPDALRFGEPFMFADDLKYSTFGHQQTKYKVTLRHWKTGLPETNENVLKPMYYQLIDLLLLSSFQQIQPTNTKQPVLPGNTEF